jgi:gentisate 1,2-dioxygenase
MNPPTNVSSPPASLKEREHFNAELEHLAMKPLWVIYRDVMTREPRTREVPYLWAWETVRPLLLRAGELITAAEAERRVLMFLNPGNPPQIGATATLYAAAQLILPGETARAHRHTPAALRFIIEGEGAYTCVEGEKIFMSPGDLILTPAMVWHDHGNEGSHPVMWLDGLDIPLTTSLNCMFVEGYSISGHSKERQIETAPRQNSEKLYGRGLFPAESLTPPARPYSPVWAYRWAEAREALDVLARDSAPDPFDGHILRYVNPATGGEALPTMGCRLQLLRKGTHTAAHRHTPSTVYHVAEGSGYSVLDGVRFNWRKGDTFAVPIWRWHEHAAETEDAVLFSITDDPVLAPLGLVRSEAYAEDGGFQKARPSHE